MRGRLYEELVQFATNKSEINLGASSFTNLYINLYIYIRICISRIIYFLEPCMINTTLKGNLSMFLNSMVHLISKRLSNFLPRLTLLSLLSTWIKFLNSRMQ